MAYRISQTDPATLTTEELLSEIDSFKVLAVEVVERLSLILKALRERRQPHPFFQHAVLRFWEGIADGQLSAEAAINLANRDMIRAVMPLSHREQIDISRGREIAIATITGAGEIRSEDVPIQRMDAATLKRAFGPDGIRTVREQAEMLREEGKIERHGVVTVLREEQVLKIGNAKVRPEDLRGPLAALGYTLDLSRNATAKAG